MANAARPTGLFVPDMGRTRAVEDKAKARPRPSAPAGFCPIRYSTKPMIKPEMVNSAAPTPKTRRRIDQRRLKDSSSPMEKSSKIMPNSANGSIASRSLIVTNLSQSYCPDNEPRPDGPSNTPTSMKPIIGVIRKRAKAGITIPAAPSITIASIKAGLSSGVLIKTPIRETIRLSASQNALEIISSFAFPFRD